MLQFNPTTDAESSENKTSLKISLKTPQRRSAFTAPPKRVPSNVSHSNVQRLTHNRPSCNIFSEPNEYVSQEQKGAKEKTELLGNDENLIPQPIISQVPEVRRPKALPTNGKRTFKETQESLFSPIPFTPGFSSLTAPTIRPETPSFGMSQLSLGDESLAKKRAKLGSKEK